MDFRHCWRGLFYPWGHAFVKVILVCNKKSGSAVSSEELAKLCDKHAVAIEKTVYLEDGFEKRLKSAIGPNAIVAAVGGDGTISAVAGVIKGTNAILAPLPGGTLNHFTKDLGVPQALDEAIGALAHKTPRQVDVATVNDRAFINNSSIGLYPSSLRERNRNEDALGKWPAAVLASMRALVRLKAYEVTIDGETLRTPFVFVGNNNYALSDVGLPERRRVDQGVLGVFVARRASRWSLFKIAVLALAGRAHALDDFDVFTTRSLTIKTRKSRIAVSRDGELDRYAPPLRYEIKPGALRVLG